jgi:hypothetical protein
MSSIASKHNDTNNIDIAAILTQYDGPNNSDKKASRSNVAPRATIDAIDAIDAKIPTLMAPLNKNSASLIAAWGCRDGCVGFQRNRQGTLCTFTDPPTDLLTNGAWCPKLNIDGTMKPASELPFAATHRM